MISLIVPVKSSQKEYTEFLKKNVEELYGNSKDVELIISEDDTTSLGQNYNNAVKKAKGEKIILLHNDMVLRKGFLETMDSYIQPQVVTSYIRVEPPIFPGQMPGKVLHDCGSDLKTFNKKKWEDYVLKKSPEGGGGQLFFGCMKEDWIGLDGETFQMFREDDDIHLRYDILGFRKIICPAYLYHFVSKTSRSEEDSKKIEMESQKRFEEKWRKILYLV